MNRLNLLGLVCYRIFTEHFFLSTNDFRILRFIARTIETRQELYRPFAQHLAGSVPQTLVVDLPLPRNILLPKDWTVPSGYTFSRLAEGGCECLRSRYIFQAPLVLVERVVNLLERRWFWGRGGFFGLSFWLAVFEIARGQSRRLQAVGSEWFRLEGKLFGSHSTIFLFWNLIIEPWQKRVIAINSIMSDSSWRLSDWIWLSDVGLMIYDSS